jgi:hypothetical protein
MRRQHAAITQLRDVIQKHDPELIEQLRLLTPGGAIPNSARTPDEFLTYLAECVGVLAKLVDQQIEANKPKKRGRPPKDRTQEAS